MEEKHISYIALKDLILEMQVMKCIFK